MHKKVYLIFFVAITCFNCGSGTFENDADTWVNVFGEDPPKEIQVINSRFWKSAHWSYEFELHVEFKTSEAFLKRYFIEHYKLVPTEQASLDINFKEEKPNWFVPKGKAAYTKFKSNRHSMVLFQDNTTKTIYLHVLQI